MVRDPSPPIRTLIIQGIIPHYRIPVFNALASNKRLHVTVMHSGKPTKSSGALYEEVVVPEVRVASLRFQRGVAAAAPQFDVVIAMFDLRWVSMFSLLRRRNFKLIWWGMGFGRNRFLYPLRARLVRHADALVVYMPNARNHVLGEGVDPSKVFVATNTILVENPSINLDPATRSTFLFIGRLQPRKRIEELFRAFALGCHQMPEEIKIDIIGSGPEEKRLRQLAVEYGIQKRIVFRGEITDEARLAIFLKKALAAVSPGQAGLSVLHSFAHGVPFITSATAISGGEIDNIVDGETGYLYDGTVEELSQKLVYLAQNRAEAVRLGQRALKHYMEHRTVEQMVGGFEQAIHYVLKERVGLLAGEPSTL
jgi:glycosyltransferase involved in cell wall biosynthesis